MLEATLASSGKRRPRALVVVGALVLAAVAYWVILRCPLPFVASWWNVDTDEGTPLRTRYRIADWFALSGSLSGMSRTEVVALLGPPAETDKFRDHSLIYVLGPERGLFSIDYEWLAVDLDSAGRVSTATVVRD
jgi:hypothetical protein